MVVHDDVASFIRGQLIIVFMFSRLVQQITAIDIEKRMENVFIPIRPSDRVCASSRLPNLERH